MVSGSELAVLGTLGGATVSGIVSLVGIKLKQNKESSRRYGEVFLEERAERLVNLYDAFARCENSIDRLKHGNRETAFDFIDIERAEVEEEIVGTFMQADKAEIFLNEAQNETLNEGLGGIMSIYLIYSDEYNEDEFDYFDEEEQAREAVDSTKELLKKEIDEPANF